MKSLKKSAFDMRSLAGKDDLVYDLVYEAVSLKNFKYAFGLNRGFLYMKGNS